MIRKILITGGCLCMLAAGFAAVLNEPEIGFILTGMALCLFILGGKW